MTNLLSSQYREKTNMSTLYHVGNLDSTREKPYFSQEGKELSVSKNPEEWRRIAKLEGTTYELYNESGCLYQVDPVKDVTEKELSACKSNNYVVEVRGFKLQTSSRFFLFYDKQDAIEMKESRGNIDGEKIVDVNLPKLGPKGEDYWESAFTKDIEDAEPIEVKCLIPIWSAMCELDVDGVYWNHPVKPTQYTCPRGAIFQSKLSRWTIQKV